MKTKRVKKVEMTNARKRRIIEILSCKHEFHIVRDFCIHCNISAEQGCELRSVWKLDISPITPSRKK